MFISFITRHVSAKTRLQWSQVFWMTMFWCLMSLLFALYKSVNYVEATDEYVFAAPRGYTILRFLLINLIGPLIAGVLAAPVIVFVLKERFRTKSYLAFIGIMGTVFFFIILILNTGVSSFFYYKTNPLGLDLSLMDFFRYFLVDPYAIRNIITWMLLGFITVTMLQISDKYGPGVLSKLILGRYYHPREEARIFMFLDLNDSTHLAEKLGNIQFFKLLNTFFADITDSILDCQGEIYQYVGDEVVVSWTIKNGLSKANCLKCFFDIKDTIAQKATSYESVYGVTPSFKAGIHLGQVIVGEIGIIKKDIVYSGDVLNTSSRILELCKVYQQEIIISSPVYEYLRNGYPQFSFSDLGEVQLRGKDKDLRLWAVSNNPLLDQKT